MDIWKAVESGEGMEELSKRFMDLDSTFRFKCRKCGKCCKNQDTILFSAWDIFRIAKKLGKTPAEVIKNYTEVYVGPQSRVPVVHLLMQGRKNACPFLSEEGRCVIHDVKPTVCALFPLGRVVTSANLGGALNDGGENLVHYIMCGQCGSGKKEHTVREWLTDFGIPEHDEFFYLWTGTQVRLGAMIREMEESGIPQSALQIIWNVIYVTLYAAYDMEQEFMPQFQEKADRLLHDIPELKEKLETASSDADSR